MRLKTLALSCIAVAVFFLFTGCSEKNSTGPESNAIVNQPKEWAVTESVDTVNQIFINHNRHVANLAEQGSLAKTSRQQLFNTTDWSGLIETKVWVCDGYGQHPSVQCDVDPGWVLVGGGARIVYSGEGAMLTASYPEDWHLIRWIANSKDHIKPCPHYLYTYAIGMRISGVDYTTLFNCMQYLSTTSSSASHPSATISCGTGYSMVGGGARVNWTGEGNLLTKCSPYVESKTWSVASKDHIKSSPATISVFGIAIKTTIPGFGGVRVASIFTNGWADRGYYENTYRWVPQYGNSALTCVGGEACYSSAGRMLCSMYPVINTTPQYPSPSIYSIAASKDCQVGDCGYTFNWAVVINKQP